jgi:hypothetical protein
MGSITIENSVFENMLDDAVNIHGVYTIIDEKLSENSLKIKYVYQRIDIFSSGDRVRIIRNEDLQPVAEAVIKSVSDIDRQYTILTFEENLPDSVNQGMALENITRMPEKVVIRGCRTGNNRPRGFLLTTPGEVIAENNTFYNADCGIEIASDANYWFESSAVNNVLIQNNTFMNCGYSWGSAAINIVPVVKNGDKGHHKNIRIKNNKFYAFNKLLIVAHHVDGLEITGNEYCKTDDYPDFGAEKFFEISQSANVVIDNVPL